MTRDHNTDNPFVLPHTQESNIIENEARVWYVHEVGAKQNRRNQKHGVDGKWEKSQTTAREGYNVQGEV